MLNSHEKKFDYNMAIVYHEKILTSFNLDLHARVACTAVSTLLGLISTVWMYWSLAKLPQCDTSEMKSETSMWEVRTQY